jgi:hypothetical protein
MSGAKLQERRFTIIVGKTKDKCRETCYAVWKQIDFLLSLRVLVQVISYHYNMSNWNNSDYQSATCSKTFSHLAIHICAQSKHVQQNGNWVAALQYATDYRSLCKLSFLASPEKTNFILLRSQELQKPL